LDPSFNVPALGKDDLEFISGPVLPILLCIFNRESEQISPFEYTFDGPLTLGKDVKHIITNTEQNRIRVIEWLNWNKIETVKVYASLSLWNLNSIEVHAVSVTVFDEDQ
jgi:hypothetical protein